LDRRGYSDAVAAASLPDNEFIRDLESTTSKTLPAWFEVMAAGGVTKFGDLIQWLQKKHGLSHSMAHKLTHLYLADRERNAPQVRYTSEGRSGTVHYISNETEFDMWYEFAGGDALAIINVPTPDQWESTTKTPLSRRTPILTFIGEQVVKDQTHGNGSFKIEDDFLTIYPGKRRR
jgi:hypothetical protein